MKISVALAMYNGAEFIKEQLLSIFNQTFPVYEIVIIDDASTDDSVSKIESLDNPYIKLIRHKTNLGPVKTFEEAINKCTGDIIFLCDQDDLWYKQKVETFINTFQETDALVCFSDAEIMNKPGSSFLEKLGITRKVKNNIYERKMDLVLSNGNIISGALSAFRKEVKHLNIFPFIVDEKYMLHDRFMYSIVASQFPDRIHFIDEPLSEYRIHDNQFIGLNTKDSDEEPMNRTDYFKYEMKLREYILERTENQHFRRSHYFWFTRSQLHSYPFLQKFIRINTLFLEGDYKRFTKNPIREALADLKL